MLIAILFWALAAACCGFDAAFGGRDGREAAAMIVAASVLTMLASGLDDGWRGVQVARTLVDVALLAGLFQLMLRSRRWWPVWMTGFHLVAVTSHFGVALTPQFLPKVYRAMESFWAIPVLVSMAVGVALDLRGSDPQVRRATAR